MMQMLSTRWPLRVRMLKPKRVITSLPCKAPAARSLRACRSTADPGRPGLPSYARLAMQISYREPGSVEPPAAPVRPGLRRTVSSWRRPRLGDCGELKVIAHTQDGRGAKARCRGGAGKRLAAAACRH